jgi:transcriptional regulator
MYTPAQFAETNLTVLHGLIKAQPFGTWVTLADSELVANHLPFMIDPNRGAYGTLVGHVARPNAVWQQLSRSQESLVIFQGPQAYISPSWYPSKQEHGKAVPTWNYAVVHAHGMAQMIEDREWLLNHVTALSTQHEASQAMPWSVADAPLDYIDKLLGAIVGIEIPIARLIGKWKLSQNRSAVDQQGVIAGLQTRDDANSHAMAELIQQRIVGAS